MYDKPPKWEEYDYKKAYWWRRGVLDEFLNAVDTVNRDLPPGEALVKASHLTVQMFAGVEELLLGMCFGPPTDFFFSCMQLSFPA